MSKKRLNRYELGRLTSTDVLEAEKADVDEVETEQMTQKELGKTVDYKKKHQEFLRKMRANDDIDVGEVKKVQMQVYASNSSEAYNLTSKASISLTIVSVIFAILMFAVAITVIVFNTMGYGLIKYDREDMTGVVNNGDVIMVSRTVYELNVDDVVVFKTDAGQEIVRQVTEIGDYIVLNTPNGDGYYKISIVEVDTRITGFVKSKMNGFGDFLMFLLGNWYYFVGGLFILMIACFVAKLMVDRHYNMLLIKKLEVERDNMEKRRKYLSETIDKLEKNKSALFDNAAVLGSLMDVNKKPDTRREKKMQKLQNQLKERQQKQVEDIKGTKEKQETNAQKEQEKQVVEFLQEKISAQEKESKAKLTKEEVERRKKIAEETNKNITN